jgi:probable blue pigment (indigoidine) exporter
MTFQTTTTVRAASTAARPALVAATMVAPVLWGMTYAVTAELLPPGRPMLAATVRALSAGLLLLLVAPWRPHGVWWARAAVLGVLNIGAFFVLLFVAAYRLPGGVAATLGSIQPLVTAGLAVTLLGERLRMMIVLAGLLGVAGVALLVLRAGAALDTVGVLAGLAGAVSMATGTVLAKRWGQPVPVAAFTSWQLIAGGVGLVPVAFVVEGSPPDLTMRNLAGFVWFATTTAVAYLLWFRGVARLPVARMSLLALLSPIVATLAGWTLLHERFTVAQLLGALLVLLAIHLGQRSPRATSHRHGSAARCRSRLIGEAVVGLRRGGMAIGRTRLVVRGRHTEVQLEAPEAFEGLLGEAPLLAEDVGQDSYGHDLNGGDGEDRTQDDRLDPAGPLALHPARQERVPRDHRPMPSRAATKVKVRSGE